MIPQYLHTDPSHLPPEIPTPGQPNPEIEPYRRHEPEIPEPPPDPSTPSPPELPEYDPGKTPEEIPPPGPEFMHQREHS